MRRTIASSASGFVMRTPTAKTVAAGGPNEELLTSGRLIVMSLLVAETSPVPACLNVKDGFHVLLGAVSNDVGDQPAAARCRAEPLDPVVWASCEEPDWRTSPHVTRGGPFFQKR